eukprot:CAMPEP_0116130872 /NCGR_PEP_ID=MMETSP0329-20121206/8705_1 /TAXON_ID=697910 /ORGANISM="Pseudo-nitzschia arenysensis, Strain B593" /LENGTH=265 /DNA_ID=CAMNT_0003625267 /DNA_START=118 /DNA_END=915 /DNA_ORIENTATION=-
MCTAPKNTSLIKSSSKKNKMSSLLILPIDFTPSPSDILCGRGNVFSNHEGNRYFGRIIRANLKEYRDAVSRPEKIRVVDDILQEIRASGVRFAKLDSETKRWYELNDVLAHQKIGHAIRDTIRLLKDKTKNTKGNTMKQSKLAKRKERPSALKLKNHVVPSSDTRKKTMDDILKMSLETSEFLNGIWGDSENVPPQQTSSMFEVKSENILASFNNKYKKERSTMPRQSRFALEDEYPEEAFDFSASTFFGDLQSFDLRPVRITSQ